jgi:hypothetical protein
LRAHIFCWSEGRGRGRILKRPTTKNSINLLNFTPGLLFSVVVFFYVFPDQVKQRTFCFHRGPI